MSREQKISKIHEYLLSRRDELRRYLAGELSQIGSDEDEESLDDEEYVVIAESEGKELELVIEAISRIRQGVYGHCEDCNAEIALVRLKALPCTKFCIECQQGLERQSSFTRRL